MDRFRRPSREPATAASAPGEANWSRLPPLTPVTQPMPLTVAPQDFADALATRQPMTVSGQLGHDVGDPRRLADLAPAAPAPDSAFAVEPGVAARPLPPLPMRHGLPDLSHQPDEPDTTTAQQPHMPLPPVAVQLTAAGTVVTPAPDDGGPATPDARSAPAGYPARRAARLGPPRSVDPPTGSSPGSAGTHPPASDPAGAQGPAEPTVPSPTLMTVEADPAMASAGTPPSTANATRVDVTADPDIGEPQSTATPQALAAGSTPGSDTDRPVASHLPSPRPADRPTAGLLADRPIQTGSGGHHSPGPASHTAADQVRVQRRLSPVEQSHARQPGGHAVRPPQPPGTWSLRPADPDRFPDTSHDHDHDGGHTVGLLGVRPIQTRLGDSRSGPPVTPPAEPAHPVVATSTTPSPTPHRPPARPLPSAGPTTGAGGPALQRRPDATDQPRPVPMPATDPATAAIDAGIAERDADGVRFRWAETHDDASPAVQTMPEGSPTAATQVPDTPGPATTGRSGGSGPPGLQAMTAAGLDELAGQLYDRIRDRIGEELRRDRERAGLATGLH